MTAIQELQ